MTKELKILTPIGMLGYGIPEAHFWRGVDRDPDAIIVDSGSTDPGPYLLGMSKTLVTPEAYRRDLSLMLRAAAERKIRLMISSAGGPGIDQHVDDMIETIRDISRSRSYHFRIAAIYANVDRTIVHSRLDEGRIKGCGPVHSLTHEAIDKATNIVAQMGAEPFAKVLRERPDIDIIVSGRSYDPAPHAALCMVNGVDPGVYWHMGKIVECGANCAEPKGRVILATVRKDSFDLEPMNPVECCTPASVAAHTLYEKTRPDLLPGPGGVLNLAGARYEPLDDRRVRVSGGAFDPSNPYTVKLEGAAVIGHRTIFIGGIRDPILIGQVDDFLARVRQRAEAIFEQLGDGTASLAFHVYGRNAVMGALEPLKEVVPHEVGLLGEVTAPNQDLANAICSAVRIDVLHMPYPGQLATSGNFAIPLNPPENPIGPVCEFSIYHLMDIDAPADFFPIRYTET
ncbi:acyclic terpene utilization AtuA family protein [Bradyrhizobium sp. WSM 1704]|uniref:acyclic terpene utilization AtuA family protein n=1 Tax=Bradyrhizobium semiaridum TaxID=2821404 RepID=UPI001CE24551|nr:acyclic terpene utilization AtuA family protein [Bradyrhizobium semiaridum]MCA6123167.1 acyclic terpene utilization AtuA family protein [Bradyrhizobium semiaridum]